MKTHFPILIATLVVTIASVVVSSASANVLLNPGFELGSDANPDDWDEFAGPVGTTGRSTSMPHVGDYSAYIEFDNTVNPAGAAYFIQQTSAANTLDNTPNYDLSFWAKTDSTNFVGTDMFAQIQWLDQDGSDGGGVRGETLTPLVPAGINTSYQQFVVSDLDAPDSADSFLLRFQVSAGAVQAAVNGMYVDDVVFEAVPEPASLSLLALGLVGLLTHVRRRRI